MAKTIKKQKGFTLIELLVVMGILAVLLAAVLIAINPDRQFKQARDSQRRSDVLAILNAVQQYQADHKGDLPGSITTTSTEIKTSGIDLCNALMPTYVSIIPQDPSLTTAAITACPVSPVTYATGYFIAKDANNRITVTADSSEIASPDIAVTR